MNINKAVGLQQDISTVGMPVRWRRIGAGCIDLVIVSCLQIWISSIFGVVDPAAGARYQTDGDGVAFFFSSIAAINPLWLYVIALFYFFAQEALFSTTIGKYFLRLYVVDMRGRRLTVMAALIRNVLRLLDSLPICYIVGLASAVLSPTFQRLGDRVAHTTVVPLVLVPHARYTHTVAMRRFIVMLAAILLFIAFSLYFSYYERPPLIADGWMNINNTWADTNPAQGVPPCGRLTRRSGDYVLDLHAQMVHIGPAQWQGSDTITYPIQYTTRTLCSGAITLQWHGFLDGGWHVSQVKINT